MLDPITNSLLRNPNFIGPIRKTDDIKKKTDQGWFTRPGDPYQYKMVDNGMIAFRNPATGEVGQFNAGNPVFQNNQFGNLLNPQPNQFMQSELANAVSGNTALQAPPAQALPPAPVNASVQVPQQLAQPAPLPTPEQAQAGADGGFVAGLIQALQTPAVQQALVQAGGAVGGPNSFAGRFAEPAGQIVDTMAEGRYLAGLMAGRTPEELEVELAGISPQARERAIGTMQEEERLELAARQEARLERGTEAQIEQGAARVEQGWASLANEESKLGLDYERLSLAKDAEAADQWATRQKLKIEQQTANSLASLRAVEADLRVAQTAQVGEETDDLNRRFLNMSRAASALSASYKPVQDLNSEIQTMEINRNYLLTEKGREDAGLSKAEAAAQAKAMEEAIKTTKEKRDEFAATTSSLNQTLQGLTNANTVPTVTTPEQLQAVPSGAEFIGPDGKRRVKQ